MENLLSEQLLIVPKPWNLSDSSIAKTESSSAALVSVETHQLDEQIKSMMTMTEKKMTIGSTTQGVYACNVCGKEDKISNIKTHIEANHIDSNISHSCDICGKISRSRDGLRQHKNKEHLKDNLTPLILTIVEESPFCNSF